MVVMSECVRAMPRCAPTPHLKKTNPTIAHSQGLLRPEAPVQRVLGVVAHAPELGDRVVAVTKLEGGDLLRRGGGGVGAR